MFSLYFFMVMLYDVISLNFIKICLEIGVV